MSKINNSSKKRSARKAPKTNQRGIIPHPPAINGYQVEHKQTLRFVCGTAVVAGAITFQNLLDLICFASTAIAPYDIFAFVKIRRIQIWGLPVIGGSTTVGLTFAGNAAGQIGDEVTHTDSSMGIEPAYLSVAPSNNALASMFQVSSAGTAFLITTPIGAVVDVHLTFRGSTTGTAQAAQNASVGAPVGATFWRSLDGRATATAQYLVPTGIAQF
jgi:hypothetical protein